MKTRGGVHQWDLTKAQARRELRVGTGRVCERISLLIGCTAVQYSIDCVRSSQLLHQSRNLAPVP